MASLACSGPPSTSFSPRTDGTLAGPLPPRCVSSNSPTTDAPHPPKVPCRTRLPCNGGCGCFHQTKKITSPFSPWSSKPAEQKQRAYDGTVTSQQAPGPRARSPGSRLPGGGAPNKGAPPQGRVFGLRLGDLSHMPKRSEIAGSVR